MKRGWITTLHGTKYHYVNDVIHNDNGPAIIYIGGSTDWYKNGMCHKEDGPAIEWLGNKAWWYNDEFIGTSVEDYTQEDFDNWKRFKAFI